jgi:hypothetical protein
MQSIIWMQIYYFTGTGVGGGAREIDFSALQILNNSTQYKEIQ